MALKVARRGMVPPFIVMDVMQAAAEREAAGTNVVHMEVGQPGTGAPRGVIDAAIHAAESQRLGYTVALGIPELRERIARHYWDWYGVEVPIRRIVVTTGSSGAFLLSFLSAFDAGDRVALADPGYPAYRNILKALGIEVVGLPTEADTRFQPTPGLVAEARNLAGLIVASPSNPTGTMIGASEMQALCDYCAVAGIRLVSDEIYHGITYGARSIGDRAVSALEFTDDAIVINSFSKYFSMTGWRLGWMVVPDDMVRAVECLAQNFFISPPSISQAAAVAAFDCTGELEANVARYAANREFLLDALPKAGFDRMAQADGAFYIYADVAELTNDSAEFCRRMLADAGVSATPGLDFDPDRGHAWVRFSFAGTLADMEEGARRLQAWKR